MRRFASVFVLQLMLMAGCSPGAATPVPEPPEFVLAPSLSSAELVLIAEAQGGPSSRAIRIDAPAGAADPGATVRLTNLSSNEPPVATQASSSGSFSISLVVRSGDVLRAQALVDGARSEPVDVVVEEMALSPLPLLECLLISPSRVFGLGVIAEPSEGVFTLENRCPDPVALTNTRLRGGSTSVSLASEVPAELLPGQTTEVVLRVEPVTVEDTLLVDVSVNDASFLLGLGVFAERAP